MYDKSCRACGAHTSSHVFVDTQAAFCSTFCLERFFNHNFYRALVKISKLDGVSVEKDIAAHALDGKWV